ncbi:multidrug effflux MFS transporter [Ruegeria lacuscaerulensis]|uniref:multidrug effflux MFS transporter n=1 Tax=Ruegeria lacuscaerulensis TaxID=55218 RepID=UPI001480F188|nr:multidrug effflux MFS transporter [Ruegeria lacuscaerulensis]
MQFGPPPARRSPPSIATLVLLSGLSALSLNLYLPSLPNMAVHFQTDYRVMQLSIALYLMVSAILQILIGPIADKAGRRPVLLWGMALFLIVTLGCIYAPNAEVFLAFRMSQAIIVVGMVLSRAAVRDLYDQDQAASMIGYVTMGMAVVPMIAPAIGGLLEESFGWKANFWLPFVLGTLTLILCFKDFGETSAKSGKTLLQQFREYPELLTSPRFWGYSMSSALSSGAFFAYLGGAPFIGTEIFGMSAAEVGVYFGAPALGYFAGNFISGRFSVKFGVNRMVLRGCILNACGVLISALLFLIGLGTPLSFFGLMTIVGIGNGMTIPNATSGALSVRPHLAATAAGLSGAIMLAGGAGLSALAGFLLTHETGAMPLLWLMLITALLAVGAIVSVIRRERRMGL